MAADPDPLADFHELPGHLIRRAQQAHNRMWMSGVSADITSPQYGILNVIVSSPGVDQKTVGEAVGIDKSTVGDVVSRLIARRLVVAYRDRDDQRRSVLYLSEEGRRAVAELAPRVVEMNRRLVDALSASEQRKLIELLDRIVTSLDDDAVG